MFTIGRIVYRRVGVFFPSENALSAGTGKGMGVHSTGEVCYLRLSEFKCARSRLGPMTDQKLQHSLTLRKVKGFPFTFRSHQEKENKEGAKGGPETG